jgi:hypothetical protein
MGASPPCSHCPGEVPVIDGKHCGEATASEDGEVSAGDGKHGGEAAASDTKGGDRQC